MVGLLELAVKTSLILALACWPRCAAPAVGAVRHWILASTLFCAAAAPLIGLLTPQWSMRRRPLLHPGADRSSMCPQSGSSPGAPASTGTVPAMPRLRGR